MFRNLLTSIHNFETISNFKISTFLSQYLPSAKVWNPKFKMTWIWLKRWIWIHFRNRWMKMLNYMTIHFLVDQKYAEVQWTQQRTTTEFEKLSLQVFRLFLISRGTQIYFRWKDKWKFQICCKMRILKGIWKQERLHKIIKIDQSPIWMIGKTEIKIDEDQSHEKVDQNLNKSKVQESLQSEVEKVWMLRILPFSKKWTSYLK